MTNGRTALVLAIALVAGCRDVSAPSEISGLEWKLIALRPAGATSDTVVATDKQELYTLLFESGGPISVRADCNTCSGRYTALEGRVGITEFACTNQQCSADSLAPQYVDLLGKTTGAAQTRTVLTLSSEAGALLFNLR